MTEPVPVSPAAQAVETPELWWSPSLDAITETGRGAVHVLTRSGVLDVTELEWADLPADAVRLVPAPAPDTGREADLLRSLDHLVGMWSTGRTYSPSARPEDDLRSALARHRGEEPPPVGVTHRFPKVWSFDGDFDNHPGPPRFTCCGRLRTEVGEHDQMAFSDDLVTCLGVRTDGETPR